LKESSTRVVVSAVTVGGRNTKVGQGGAGGGPEVGGRRRESNPPSRASGTTRF
jgi:hypothetical protein